MKLLKDTLNNFKLWNLRNPVDLLEEILQKTNNWNII